MCFEVNKPKREGAEDSFIQQLSWVMVVDCCVDEMEQSLRHFSPTEKKRSLRVLEVWHCSDKARGAKVSRIPRGPSLALCPRLEILPLYICIFSSKQNGYW